MADIYSNAALTLAATASPDSTGGLFRTQQVHSIAPEKDLPATYEFRDEEGTTFTVAVRPKPREDFTTKRLPLQERAWFFQEWLLSPRIVHFADTMLYWECASTERGEEGDWFDGRYWDRQHGRRSTLMSSNRLPLDSLSPLGRRNLHTATWHAVARSYSGLQLSYATDVFPALQGLSTRMAAQRQTAYHAGLWRDSLVVDLLWAQASHPVFFAKLSSRRISSAGGSTADESIAVESIADESIADESIGDGGVADEYVAPTWSWASYPGEVFWPTSCWLKEPETQQVLIQEASIVSVATTTVSDNPFGQVLDGELVLKGLCLPAMLEPSRTYENRPMLLIKTERVAEPCDLLVFDNYELWYPDIGYTSPLDADIVVMLIGILPSHSNDKYKLVNESWFLVFERASHTGDIYARIGLLRTHNLAARARFLRHAVEQQLTII